MALKSCKECGSQVSDKADRCPSCGAKVKKPISLLAFLGILFILFAFIGSCLTKPSSTVKNNEQYNFSEEASSDIQKRLDESQANHIITKSKRLLKNSAKDEGSLKYRNITTNKTDKFGLVACGEFNGKNSFGAMTGFTRFISSGQTLFIDGANDSTIPFDQFWTEACLK